MTDEERQSLVNDLRYPDDDRFTHTARHEAAGLIDSLTAQRDEWNRKAIARAKAQDDAELERDEARAERDRLREALHLIAEATSQHGPHMNYDLHTVAREALRGDQ